MEYYLLLSWNYITEIWFDNELIKWSELIVKHIEFFYKYYKTLFCIFNLQFLTSIDVWQLQYDITKIKMYSICENSNNILFVTMFPTYCKES